MHRKDFSRGWTPDADAVNGPVEGLLRMDNLVLLEENVPSLRPGSSKVNSSAFADTDIHTLHTFVTSTGTRYRAAGAGSSVYINGTKFEGVTFDGSGDLAVGQHMGHALAARGTTKKKHNGASGGNWGFAAPTEAGTCAVVDPYTATLANCNQTESPGFVAQEGTITATYPDGHDGTANGSLEVTPNATSGRFSVSRTLSAATDFSTIAGYEEDPQDLFDMYVWLQQPHLVEWITVQIGVSSGTDPWLNDLYSHTFEISSLGLAAGGGGPAVAQAQDLATLEDAILDRSARSATTSQGARAVERAIDRIRESRAQIREARRGRGAPGTNPGWGHLTVSRGQFVRSGNTNGRNWSTVTGIKIIAKQVGGATSTIRFDDVKIIGAAKVLALTGDYRIRHCWVKDHGNGWIEKSPPSPESAKVSVLAQGIQYTVTASSRQAKDPQADKIWIYLFGGHLDRYYRAMATAVEPRAPAATAMRIDEFMKTADGSNLNTAAQRTRFSCFGFTIPVGVSSSSSVTYDVFANEVDMLLENEPLDATSVPPPDNIISIDGPHHFRTFVLTSDGLLYPSHRNDPGLYNTLHAIRVGDTTEKSYWCKRTTAGVYVGTSKDIKLVEGTGDELQDETLDFRLRSLNVGNPPISEAVAVHGNTVLYLAADGWRMMVGDSSLPVPRDDVSTLYKGLTRHGVSAPNLTGGRFRAAVWKDYLVAITPEGASTTASSVMHVFDMVKRKWYRHTWTTPAWRSIHTEPDGTLIAGDTSGFVWQIYTGTRDDDTDIPVVLWTKVDDDGQPSNRKDAYDLLTRLDTGGNTATVALHLDGSSSATTSYTAAVTGMGLHKRALKTADDASGLAAFRQIQLRVTGNFPAFKWYDFDLTYRLRPKTRMFLDTGYFPIGHHEHAWLREVFLMVDSPNDLTVKVYTDDTLASTSTLAVSANVARPYTVQLGRGVKGYQGRITVETTNAAGSGEVGFECYWIRPRVETSGNVTQKPYLEIVPDRQ